MPNSLTNAAQFTLPVSKKEAREFVARYPGLVTVVAQRLGVRVATVSQVIYNRTASSRIVKEVAAEVRRREKSAA